MLPSHEQKTGGSTLHEEIRGLITHVPPVDPAEEEHLRQALAWLDRTRDIFRRVKPSTPDPHLVCYFLLIDHQQDAVLLVDHRQAGLWLPTGGHVEPGEHPVATVHREAREELGIEAEFSPHTGGRPLFVTVNETAPVAGRHTDVCLWYILTRALTRPLTPDPGEFREARWWTRAQIERADPALFDPHMNRMLGKFDSTRSGYKARSPGRGGSPTDADREHEPSEQLLRQVMSDVEELVARHRWETAPRRRMLFLLGEALELAEEILRLPEAGPYEAADRQRIGWEVYDVLWNACAVARSAGVDVVGAAAEKKTINQTRVWPSPRAT